MSLLPSFTPAILALADGTVFAGQAIGADGETSGEVVFNTAMSGYQEILTDPSYCRQIVTLTYPHIGNTGCNAEDFESAANYAAGLVIRDLPLCASNWRSQGDLSSYLKKHGIVAIAGIDTRKLTRILRDKGAQAGCIMAGNVDDTTALAVARAFPGLAGMDLAKVVSAREVYVWSQGEWTLKGYQQGRAPRFHVVAYDFGVKRNILRMLAARGCRLTVVPAQTPAAAVLALQPDGVFLSNGPGDPEPCDYAITAIREFLDRQLPVFGICLGHQLLAECHGVGTLKMHHGHRGINHPVRNIITGKDEVTSQNHGFVVDREQAEKHPDMDVTHLHLNDGSVAGTRLKGKPVFSVQHHPEAGPGPLDSQYLFDDFVGLISRKHEQTKVNVQHA